MNELDMKPLDLWKHVQKLSVDEFMCLMFGFEPGAMKFDYGNPTDWPKNADLIYRMLTEDLQAKKLPVFFEEMAGDPFYNGAYDKFYAGNNNPWWAACDGINCVGKIQRCELVKWLAEKNIPSVFFGVTATPATDVIHENNAELAKQHLDRDATTAQQPQTEPTLKVKKQYQRGAISANVAASILGVSERQVQNWDAGINMPDGYPGRRNEAAFQLFANEWKRLKNLTAVARAMNRPVSGGGIADKASRDAFGEE